MLTLRQKRVLDFIKAKVSAGGIAPSFQEIADHMGVKSKSAIYNALAILEHKGFVRRLRGRARAIEVIDRPDEVAQLRAENDLLKGKLREMGVTL